MLHTTRALVLLGAAHAVACVGAVDEEPPAAPAADAGAPAPDADPGAGAEAGCALPAELGSFGGLFEPFAGDRHQDSPPPGQPDARTLYVEGAIGEPTFRIAFHDQRGVFAGGAVTTGTFELAAPDDGISAEVVLGDARYELVAGAVAVDSVSELLTGAGHDLVLAAGDGCQTGITLVAFDAPITQVRAVGEACDPEPCQGDALCVGTRASNRICRAPCETTEECPGVDECRALTEDAPETCVPPLQ